MICRAGLECQAVDRQVIEFPLVEPRLVVLQVRMESRVVRVDHVRFAYPKVGQVRLKERRALR